MNCRNRYISNPLFLYALFLLLLNDLYLKTQYGNWFTGKLSDFSGLIVFYCFCSFVVGRKPKILIFLILFIFCFWKSHYSQLIIDTWNYHFNWMINRTVDYTDLTALIVLPFTDIYLNQLNKTKTTLPIYIIILPLTVFSITGTSYMPKKYEHEDYFKRLSRGFQVKENSDSSFELVFYGGPDYSMEDALKSWNHKASSLCSSDNFESTIKEQESVHEYTAPAKEVESTSFGNPCESSYGGPELELIGCALYTVGSGIVYGAKVKETSSPLIYGTVDCKNKYESNKSLQPTVNDGG